MARSVDRRVPRIPADLAPWFEARSRFRLSHAAVQMARELGLNPNKLGSLADTRGSAWKLPLPDFIAACYAKAYKRESPLLVRTLEQVLSDRARKKLAQKERKVQRRREKAATDQPAAAEPSLP